MAFNAVLKFFDSGFNKMIGDEIKVMEFDISFTQQIDMTGKPSAKPMGGTINLKVESSDTYELIDWMIAEQSLKNGEIVFWLRDDQIRAISFEDAACISFHEVFNYDGSIPMNISLTISARKIQYGDVTYDNSWILE